MYPFFVAFFVKICYYIPSGESMINTTKLDYAIEEQKSLLNKIKNHLIKIDKYTEENNKLYSKSKELRKNIRYNIWFSILTYLLSFLLLYYLRHNITLNMLLDLLFKTILYITPHINCYYQMKELCNNIKEFNEINKKYIIISQNLFAEKFFLNNAKSDYEKNKINVFLLRKELGSIINVDDKFEEINSEKNNIKILNKNLHNNDYLL